MTQIHKFSFYRNDPLMILLRNKLHFNWWHAFVAWIVLWGVDSLLYSLLTDVYYSRSGMITFEDDLSGQIATSLWTGAVLIAYYVWSGNAFLSTFWKLSKNGSLFSISEPGLLKLGQKDYFWAVNKLEPIWNHRAWTILGFFIASLWTLFVFIPLTKGFPNFWWKAHSIYLLYSWIKGFFWSYFVFRIVSLEFLGIYSIYKLVTWKVLKFRAFHPDESGGLFDIGQYRLGFVYGIMGVSIFFIFLFFREYLNPSYVTMAINFVDIILFLLLFSLIPVSFFASVWKVHGYMKSEKSNLIAPIANALEIKLQEPISIKSQSTSISTMNQQVPQDLINTIETLKRSPEWPFNTGLLRQLFGSWISTLVIPLIIELIISLVTKTSVSP